MKKRIFILCLITLHLMSCKKKQENNKTLSQEKVLQQTDTKTQKETLPSQEKKDPITHKMQVVIQDYCQSLNTQDFDAVSGLFTPEVNQWITLKNIQNTTISKEANRFLSTKLNVYYRPDFVKMHREGQVAYLPIAMSWEGYFAEVEAEIKFNKDFKITSYRESKILKTKGDITGGGTFKELWAKFPPVKNPDAFSYTVADDYANSASLKELQYLFKFVKEDIFYASGSSTFHPVGSYQSGDYIVLVLKELTEEDMTPAGAPTSSYLFIFDKKGKLTYHRNIGFNYPGAAMSRSYTETVFEQSGENLWLEITEGYSSYYEDINEGEITKYRLDAQGKLEKTATKYFSEDFLGE